MNDDDSLPPESPGAAIHYQRAEAPNRPSALLGCFTILTLVVALGLAAGACVIFLDSGADTGTLVLEQAESYERGSLRYYGESNVYLVRLPDGVFYALSNLDQANRAAEGSRCRVQSTAVTSPSIADRYAEVAGAVSPAAAGANAVFTESCNGAIYDATGIVLTGLGYNLDRHPVSVRDDGRLAIELAERECTRRTEQAVAEPVVCP